MKTIVDKFFVGGVTAHVYIVSVFLLVWYFFGEIAPGIVLTLTLSFCIIGMTYSESWPWKFPIRTDLLLMHCCAWSTGISYLEFFTRLESRPVSPTGDQVVLCLAPFVLGLFFFSSAGYKLLGQTRRNTANSV